MPEPVLTEREQILVRLADYLISNGTSFSGTLSRIAEYNQFRDLTGLNRSLDTLHHPNWSNGSHYNEALSLVLTHLGRETRPSENSDPPSPPPTTSSVPSGTARAVVIGEPQTLLTSKRAASTYKEFIRKISSTGSSSSKGRRSSRSSKRSRKVPEQTNPGITPPDPALSQYETNETTVYGIQTRTVNLPNYLLSDTQAWSDLISLLNGT